MSQTATQRLQWVTQRLDELGGQGIISLLKQKVQASTKYLKYVEELLTETPHSSDSNAGGDQPSPSRQPRKRETAPAKSIKQALTRSLSASSQIPDRYRLSAVFSDLELQKMFLRYLKKNFCEENLLFLLELEAFEKLPSDKLLRTIDQINLNYISRNSKKELNLNASTKKQFANALESLHSSFDEKVARTIFNQCKIEITALLETDSFHKFSKTKEFIAYRKFVEAETIPESMRKSANVATEDLNLEDHSVIDIRFILREPILKRSLYTFMKKSHCEENLEFVERVSEYENCPVTSLLTEANDIYNQFVKSNAPAEINIDAQTKKGIEQTIEKLKTEFEETDAREIFSEAKKYITGLIQMNSVHKFLTSTEYKDCRTTFDKIRGQAESETSQNLTLSESDWELINTGSIIRTFAQGESIILQGDTSAVVYFLVSGVVSCRCTRENKRVDIPPLDTPGMIFGELGLFHSLPAYSSYVVQSEFVKLRELKVSFLLRLFEAHPALGVRIYNFIGQQLAGVITYEGLTDQLSQQPLSPQATHLAKQPRSTPRAIEEDNFAKTFPDIAQKETLIVSHQVSVPRSVVRSGTIYISQHYLSFTSMIFGQKSKELYPLFASTTTVQPVKDLDFLITAKSHKRKFRMKSRETRDVVLSLLESLLTIESEDTHKFAVSASESKSMELSEEEWKLILGSEAESCIQFVKGDYIMHKGLTYKTLFQTVSGAYNVEKVIAGSKTVLAQLEAGEVLGEINFFTHKAATASIVVTSPTAEVFLIHKERLWKELLVTHPKVVVRFYNHLCYILGLRLTKSQ